MDSSTEMKLKRIIVENSLRKIDPEDIEDESELIEDFGYDSVAIVRLILRIETELGIEFDDDHLGLEVLGAYKDLREYAEKALERLNTPGTADGAGEE